jgi:hypothetical protein
MSLLILARSLDESDLIGLPYRVPRANSQTRIVYSDN